MDAELRIFLSGAVFAAHPGCRISWSENPPIMFVKLPDGTEHEIGLETGAPEMDPNDLAENILEAMRR